MLPVYQCINIWHRYRFPKPERAIKSWTVTINYLSTVCVFYYYSNDYSDDESEHNRLCG